MSFNIRERNSENDMENFFRSCLETAKNTNDFHYTSLKKKHPDKNEDEIFELFKEEIVESFDFENPDCKIFMLDGEQDEFAGYIWVGIRDSEDAWDFERPLWVYDISVQLEFRRRGLSIKLLERAEAFAKELNRNIGLFVHAQNTGAIGLYKKCEYRVKCAPISKEPERRDNLQGMNEFAIREMIPNDRPAIQSIGVQKFKRLVEFTADIPENQVVEKYYEYWEKYLKDDNKHAIFVGVNNAKNIIGFIWVGEAFFSERIAMVYDFAINDKDEQIDLKRSLFMTAENWVKNEEFNRFYMLLHANEDITLEECHDLGLREPGYFMEKKLKL